MTSPHPAPQTPPPERKPLGTFALHAAFLTLLLSLLPLDTTYGVLVERAGNALFGQLGPQLRVEYRWLPPGASFRSAPAGRAPADDGHPRDEVEMTGLVRGQREPVWSSSFSVVDRGYRPTAVLVALLLATPLSRRRRAVALALGVPAFFLFLLAQTAFLAVTLFARVESSLVPLGGLLAAGLPVTQSLFGSPLVRYAAVFVLWAVTADPPRHIDATAAIARLRRWLGGR